MTFDPNPTNPIGCAGVLVLIFAIGLFGIFTVRVGTPETMTPGPSAPLQARPETIKPESPDMSRGPLPAGASLLGVESATVDVRDSGQVVLEVNGSWPDGCDLPVEVNTTVTPQLVSVVIYRVVPQDVFCTMMLQPYSGEIDISPAYASAGSAVDPARVPVIVNGVAANPLTK